MYNPVETCEEFGRTIGNYYGNQAARSLHAQFVQQPPEDLRKSNFFKFAVGLRGSNNDPLEILKARFIGYLNETSHTDLRNGIQYEITAREQRMELLQILSLYITLVDAATREPIRYEGQDDSPKLRRVLLTHETICTRCSQQKSCGNKNEAPSDPLIHEKGILKFFLRCNQNCLKSAGNPKDMRRFSVAVSSMEITHDKSSIMALSQKIFVHNNSKHSRKRRKEHGLDESGQPKVLEIFPKNGTVGTNIAVFGEKFCEDMCMFMSGVRVKTKVLSDRLLQVTVPRLHTDFNPLTLQPPVGSGHEPVHCGIFRFDFQSANNCAFVHPKVGVRGEELIIFAQCFQTLTVCQKVPNLTVLCNNFFLDSKVIEGGAAILTLIPPSMNIGFCEITVILNNQVVLYFKYQIQDRNHPDFSQQYGFLRLQANIHISKEDPTPYNEVRYISHPDGYMDNSRNYICNVSTISSTASISGSSQSACKWECQRLYSSQLLPQYPG